MCNELFNLTEGKRDEFKYVKWNLVEGINKPLTDGDANDSNKKLKLIEQ